MTLIDLIEQFYSEEIRLFCLMILLTLLNINLDHVGKLQNKIRIFYYKVLSKTREFESFLCKYWTLLFKKLRCNVIRESKLEVSNYCINIPCLPASFTTSLYEIISMKRIKIPRPENCNVMWRIHSLHNIWMNSIKRKYILVAFCHIFKVKNWLKIYTVMTFVMRG